MAPAHRASRLAGDARAGTWPDRQAEIILTPAAQVAARGADLFPGVTARLLHAMSVMLPDPADEHTRLARGRDLRPALSTKLFDKLTALGRSAARRLNEISG